MLSLNLFSYFRRKNPPSFLFPFSSFYYLCGEINLIFMTDNMKKSVLLVMLLLFTITMTSCNSRQKQSLEKRVIGLDTTEVRASDDAVIADSAQVKAGDDILRLINDLYAAIGRKEESIDGRFACQAWCELVAAVKEKDSHLAEIGFFNEDYWTQMQDTNPDSFEICDAKFLQLDARKGVAVVDFVLHSTVQDVHAKFQFCRDDGDWRIHDIIWFFDDGTGKEEEIDLMEGMKNYLAE